jgi:hypothetical protein
VAEAAVATFEKAQGALARLGNEFTRIVLEVTTDVARRVNEEDTNAGDETFAAACIRGLFGEPTEESQCVTLLVLSALEWPINEQGVRDLLDI